MSIATAAIDLATKAKRATSYLPDPLRAPGVQAKLDAALAELARLKSQYNASALAAIEELPGPEPRPLAQAFQQLKDRIAEQEQHVADTNAALTAAKAADDAVIQANKLAMHRNTVSSIRTHLKRRDAAAETFSTHIARAAEAYKQMVGSAGKAYALARPLIGGDVIAGHRLSAAELYRDSVLEVLRLTTSWPVTTESKTTEPKFPNDYTIASPVKRPALQTPLAHQLRQQSEGFIDILSGKPPRDQE